MKSHDEAGPCIRRLALRLAASVALALLCAGTAVCQGQCPYNVAPGETIRIKAASYGDAAGLLAAGGAGGAGFFVEQGDYQTDQNILGAFSETAGILANVASAEPPAYSLLTYQFCVPGHANDTVNATISANVSWVGILGGWEIGAKKPSVKITLTLIDLGADGTDSIVIGSAEVLNYTADTFSVNIPGAVLPVGVTFGYTPVSGSKPVPIPAQITVGHFYAIQYRLQCTTPTDLAGGAYCNFLGKGVPNNPATPFALFPVGNYGSHMDSLAVIIGFDEIGAILDIKAQVEALSAQITGNDRDVAAAKLVLEKENAQLLGILDEIKSLLSAKPADPPPAPTSGKTKTGDPKPPIRPVRPAANDPP